VGLVSSVGKGLDSGWGVIGGDRRSGIRDRLSRGGSIGRTVDVRSLDRSSNSVSSDIAVSISCSMLKPCPATDPGDIGSGSNRDASRG
jgi:hypothetical protein